MDAVYNPERSECTSGERQGYENLLWGMPDEVVASARAAAKARAEIRQTEDA